MQVVQLPNFHLYYIAAISGVFVDRCYHRLCIKTLIPKVYLLLRMINNCNCKYFPLQLMTESLTVKDKFCQDLRFLVMFTAQGVARLK